jgi:MFS family permease
MENTFSPHPKRAINLAVLVAALGYFVDIYDLLLFSIVRITSLKSLGVPESELLSTGSMLLSMQMGGMLVGGILWGILGDKKGRLSVLFGSIILYSLANIANGFVQSVEMYSVLRIIAGIGLAGELGAGVTLVSEVCRRNLEDGARRLLQVSESLAPCWLQSSAIYTLGGLAFLLAGEWGLHYLHCVSAYMNRECSNI